MRINRTIGTAILGGVLLAFPVMAQDEPTDYRSDATAQAIGSFVKSTVDDGVEQSATHSGGVLASYRFYFSRHHGVEVDYGYALNTQHYRSPAGQTGVRSYSHSATAAYVFRYPLRRITPFVLAGAGGLVFDPRNLSGADYQARAAFVYGGGADFNLAKRVFLRFGYRGLVYESPNFGIQSLNSDRVTHRAEPFGGIGFRF